MAMAKLLSRLSPLETGQRIDSIGEVLAAERTPAGSSRTSPLAESTSPPALPQCGRDMMILHHEPCCRACHATNSLRVDCAQGDRVCTQCGVVDEERLMDDRPEWRDYADADDGAGGATLARCGMVAVDESLYVGGLQPTTLSRHLYGGPTGAGSGSQPSGAPRQLQLRQRLAATARRIDRRMAQLSARSLDAARWHRRASQAQHHRKRKSTETMASVESGTDGGDTTHDEEDGDHESSADLRPEYEQLLLQEEEDAARVRDALYADKWSLSRAIRLFGTQHEISLLQGSDATLAEEVEERGAGSGKKRGRLDSTLTQASRDLYRAYAMLRHCAHRLQLPERVQGDAVEWLCRYAGRRDGLTVRGVSSAGPKRLGGELGTVTRGARTAASPRQERLARAALSEHHKLKQSGALCAALVFYSCRCQGWPRPLDEVCASVQPMSSGPSTGDVDPLYLAVDPGTTPFIQKKHCSRAMNDVRRVFPELAQKLAALVAPTHAESSAAEMRSDAPDPASILSHLVEHKVRTLQLPPVAEAVVRSLACHWQQLQQQSQSQWSSDVSVKDGGKWSALCAALTLFACHAGSIMQRLASQATKSKRRKLANGGCGSEATVVSPSSFDVFDPSSSTEVCSAEQRAYEMGRVWDAWSEQTPWCRTLAEVERSFQVPAGSILDVYRKQVYPERGRLLRYLQDSVTTTTATTTADDRMARSATASRDSLRGTPLSSVLLPQIPVVTALLNEDPTQQSL